MCFRQIPMLPQKLLEEVGAGVSSALFKTKEIKKRSRFFFKFPA
jgi:hypothetical protein